jgi:hypothetical protein
MRKGKCSAAASAINHSGKRIDLRSSPGTVVIHIAFEHNLHLFSGFQVDDRFVLSGINVAFMFDHADIKLIFEHPVNHLIVDLLPVASDQKRLPIDQLKNTIKIAITV